MILCPDPGHDGLDDELDSWNDLIYDTEGRYMKDDLIYHPELRFSIDSWKIHLKHPFRDGRRNLLLVSKQISLEATATLYGTSIFRFDDSNIMKAFLAGIGQNRQHLKRVRLMGNVALGSAFPASRMLAEALKLQWVQLRVSGYSQLNYLHSRSSSNTLFESLRPLYQMFFERDGDFETVMDERIVVRYGECRCWEWNASPNTSSLLQKCGLCLWVKLLERMELEHHETAYRHYEIWNRRIERRRMIAKIEAGRAERRKTRSRPSPKKRKRSDDGDDEDDKDDTAHQMALSRPAPEPSRKMPGRRAKSMTSYEIVSEGEEEMGEEEMVEDDGKT